MKEYQIAAILWEDHSHAERQHLKEFKGKDVVQCLSVGIIYKETKKYIVLVSTIEKMNYQDDADWLVILKGTIKSIKPYGKITLSKFR